MNSAKRAKERLQKIKIGPYGKVLESAQEPEAIMGYANALVDEYETFCRKCLARPEDGK